MTTIEKKIYQMLEATRVGAIQREAIAILYAQAFNSSHRIYSRINWQQLHARMKVKLGQRSLDSIKRKALASQAT